MRTISLPIIKFLSLSLLILLLAACGATTDSQETPVQNSVPDTVSPLFTTPSELTVFENTTQIIKVKASDDNPVTYNLDTADFPLFEITLQGDLSFKSPCDYETNTTYTVSVIASDGVNTSLQTITIHLLDVDENSPLFTTPSTTVTVDENQLNVLQVSATDESTITFSLQGSDSNSFSINENNGTIKFKNLSFADFETKSQLQFQVVASDGLNDSTQDIVVNLRNLNDNAPLILGDSNPTLNENSTYIASYTVTDIDGDISSVTLSNNLFEFNTSTNILSFINAPDYEVDAHSYTLTMNASDGLLTSSKNITISLINVSDVLPTLSNFATTLSENVPLGTTVGTVLVTQTGDSEISEFTLSGLGSDKFEIDIDGKITTKSSIDYETVTNHRYDLTVKATNAAGESESKTVTINILDINEIVVPTLVVIMNWNNESETDALLWHNKIFNTSVNSVARWYEETTSNAITFVPVPETSETPNDGIIMVNMGIDHPGGNDDTTFRDTHIKNAISSATVNNAVDFASLDVNSNGELDLLEVQIIFIVAGGEASYGDSGNVIWAHAWSFPSSPGVTLDGVKIMTYNGDPTTSGSYARFGANHDDHSATIGVIVHELGHSLLNLHDFYDDGGGSGLGWYDVMSSGAWAAQDTDTYPGDTPTQFSVYNKNLSGMTVNTTLVNSTTTVTIHCSESDLIKLPTTTTDEYFLIECRDTQKINSDISMNRASNGGFSPNNNASFSNSLFSVVYHVDDTKYNNLEDGVQTSSNHYNISVLEKETTHLMTNTENIYAEYNDVLTEGDMLGDTRTILFDGTNSGYSIEILDSDYTNRTMSIKITK